MRKSPRRHKRAAAVRGVTASLGLAAMQQLPTTTAHLFPYVPTQILMPVACWNGSTCGGAGADLAYVFSQTESGSVRFSALNYSGTVGGAESQLMRLTTELPFLQDEPVTTAFGAARASDGSVMVYSGACDGAAGSIWRYSTMNGDGESGAWSNKTTTAVTTTTTTTTTSSKTKASSATGTAAGPFSAGGPSFLGGALAFSRRLAPVMDQPTMYTYGGMCNVPDGNSTSWQSSANYTTRMMALAPVNNRDSGTAYSPGVASAAGPRTPMAGFTLTQLPASTTDMSGSVTQQAGFLLLGGHTQQAFINMSTAAVWNLPEQSWSYIDVADPDPSTAELSMRGEHEHEEENSKEHERDSRKKTLLDRAAVATPIESRSGHTAVLAEDGASVIVFGGWVGDVGTPAQPQLVVLQLSQTYSSWRWAVPRAQPVGNGVYGHGAAMLPGNVMMVYGGWETSASSSSSSSKRQTVAAAAGGGGRSLRFFNVTSSSWSNSYTNPASLSAAGGGNGAERSSAGRDDDGVSEQHRRLELGLGLGLGLGLLLAVLATCCLWRSRRRQRRREKDAREAVQAMEQDAQYFVSDADEMAERNDAYAWHARSKLHDGYAAGLAAKDASPLAYESLRAARASLDDGEDDAGHFRHAMGTRKPVSSSRAMSGEGGGGGGGSGGDARFNVFVSPPGRIHPIMEDDEELDDDAHTRALLRPLTPTSDVHSDPFVTPVSPTAPSVAFLPTAATTRSAAAIPQQAHPLPQQPQPHPLPQQPQPQIIRNTAASSPDDHRHSDPDVQDWVSDVDAADSLLERYNSSRSKARVSLMRGSSTRSAALRDDESRSGSNLSDSNRSGLLLADQPNTSSSSTTSSYNTARSGFATLLAEGPALLTGEGAAAPANYPDHDQDSAHPTDYLQPPTSPSKTKPRRSWLGSLGRVFSHSSSHAGDSRRAGQDRDGNSVGTDLDLDSAALTGDYEATADAPGALRGALLRRKQGRQDWGEEDEKAGGGGAQTDAAGDWDSEIERAVERRLVQVMFTVPKERLRVVNGGDAQLDEHAQDLEADAATTHSSQAQRRPDVHIIPATPAAEVADPVSHPDQQPQPQPQPQPHPGSQKKTSPADEDEYAGRTSHSTDDSGKRSSGAVYLAEAVTLRFERPRGRVLRMVQSIEREGGRKWESESEESRAGSVKSI
ncbi:hypothetical protein E4U21_001844 [Claviceps maximensis]|nr:hypothetical protein E4U21_001844 [Claviceps maximensis]